MKMKARSRRKSTRMMKQRSDLDGQMMMRRENDMDMFADKGKQRQEDRGASGGKETDVAPYAATGKYKPKLELSEIEGQEMDSTARFDSEGGGQTIEAFNMVREMEEGSFDAAGNYIRNKRDEGDIHDSWLSGVSDKDIEAARIAQERKEEHERRENARAESAKLTKLEIWKSMLEILQPQESVMEALQRLGREAKANQEKLSRQQGGDSASAKKLPKWKLKRLQQKAESDVWPFRNRSTH